MNEPLKVEAQKDERSSAEAAAAAPVSLPAGSYDITDLHRSLDEAAKPKNAEKRDELIGKALEQHNQTQTSLQELPEGYSRVPVVDEASGISEERVVFTGETAAPAKPAAIPAAAAADTKGE